MLPPTAFDAGGSKHTYNQAKKECREEWQKDIHTYMGIYYIYKRQD
jgi:hypothetical protein